ncbi:hypothetical protein FisN_14Lu323 [Fistulifera solaris]|uniref:Uncharacterized protein n=1 Tax=Fistulifera solaris TaxID=1519565 RepID=A0A1Z5JI49_FISSO|nr:hypothetical protein FisN_14Lu323 [Fistulifera solaris]|eukprot:GAX13677.1 hypothetical protein FisN_14Lu323 [Fistulifera solaris]
MRTLGVTALVLVYFAAKATAFVHSTKKPNSLLPSTTLFSAPPPRKARRDLKKRRNRVRDLLTGRSPEDAAFWEQSESRPLISSNAKEKGQDYWVDEEALKREQEREAARIAARQSGKQVPDEKLWGEILSPYRQNWIGFISVFIITIAFIIQNFPELVENPIIQLPDL